MQDLRHDSSLSRIFRRLFKDGLNVVAGDHDATVDDQDPSALRSPDRLGFCGFQVVTFPRENRSLYRFSGAASKMRQRPYQGWPPLHLSPESIRQGQPVPYRQSAILSPSAPPPRLPVNAATV